ncbi:MAG: anthranilate 1,2-dioxygenase large subunit [Rhodospirillaceae bacterium]|nr:anthranilate 1,2-dioxygenase large subunit [Rhodospirillaceae bacterium]
MTLENDPLVWPNANFSRVPYSVFESQEIFDREQQRVFRGPVWSYLCLEAEIPKPGDYLLCYVGDTEVVVTRKDNGDVASFVNRCAHRGSTIVRLPRGNIDNFTCVYHHWCYDSSGDLIGVPFQRGIKGKGGMPATFNKKDHGLEKLRVESYRGAVFGSFDPTSEPLVSYLDKPMTAFLDQMFAKPIRIIGYMRQRIPANWKLYYENMTDSYHAGLLHQFGTTFGLWRNTQKGGIVFDKMRRHAIEYSVSNSDDATSIADGYDGVDAYDDTLKLRDRSIIAFRDEWGDGRPTHLLAVFPNAMFQKISNTLATRQIRPKGPGEFELYWTYFGYQDDDDQLKAMRLEQVNLVGPGGLISMEDGESGRLIQRTMHTAKGRKSVLEMGGTEKIEDEETLVTETPLRAFWRYYRGLMDFPLGEGVA